MTADGAGGDWKRGLSAQKRTLETHLEARAHAGAIVAAGGGQNGCAGGAQMGECVQERVGGGASRRTGLAAQQRADGLKPEAQARAQMIKCFQREGASQRLDGGLERETREQPGKQPREHQRIHAVARQRRA